MGSKGKGKGKGGSKGFQGRLRRSQSITGVQAESKGEV
jgi:hypothetical protein